MAPPDSPTPKTHPYPYPFPTSFFRNQHPPLTSCVPLPFVLSKRQNTQTSPMIPGPPTSPSTDSEALSRKHVESKKLENDPESYKQDLLLPTPLSSPTSERSRSISPPQSPDTTVRNWLDGVPNIHDKVNKEDFGSTERTGKAARPTNPSLAPKPASKPKPDSAKPLSPFPLWPLAPGPGAAPAAASYAKNSGSGIIIPSREEEEYDDSSRPPSSNALINPPPRLDTAAPLHRLLPRPDTPDRREETGGPRTAGLDSNVGLGVWVVDDSAWPSPPPPSPPPPPPPPPPRPDSPAPPPEPRPISPSPSRLPREMNDPGNIGSASNTEPAGHGGYSGPHRRLPSHSLRSPDGPRHGPYQSRPISPPPPNEMSSHTDASSASNMGLRGGGNKYTPPKPNPNPSPQPGPYGPPPYPPPDRPLPPLPKPKPQQQPQPKDDTSAGYDTVLRGGAGEDAVPEMESEDVGLSELWDLLSRLQNQANRYLAYQHQPGGNVSILP